MTTKVSTNKLINVIKMLTPFHAFFCVFCSIALESVGVIADWIEPPTRRAKTKSGIKNAAVKASL